MKNYPTAQQIEDDVVVHETAAINLAVEAMEESIADCPLKRCVMVYSAIKVALKFADGDFDYVLDVLNESRVK